jgi:hypothetical protein
MDLFLRIMCLVTVLCLIISQVALIIIEKSNQDNTLVKEFVIYIQKILGCILGVCTVLLTFTLLK